MTQVSRQKIIWVSVLTGLVAGAAAGAILKFLFGGDHAVVAAGVAGGVVGGVVSNMTRRERESCEQDGGGERS